MSKMKSQVYPGTKARMTRFLHKSYKVVRRATGVDPIKESARIQRVMDKVLYKNIDALGDEFKLEALIEYINEAYEEYIKRMRLFYTTLIRYSYTDGQLKAVRHMSAFITDEVEEKKRLIKIQKKELRHGKEKRRS